MNRKTIVVTGGSSGIGKAIVGLLLSGRYRVFILARNAENTNLSKKENCFAKNIDIRKIPEIKLAVKWVKQRIGRDKIDGLINCAGVGYETPLESISEEDYENFFSTNVKGTIFACKFFMPLLRENTGIIINFSSIAGVKGFSRWSLYCATKFAIEGFTDSLRYELRNKRIRLTNIEPGSVNTLFYQNLKREEKKEFINSKTIAELVLRILNMERNATVEKLLINNTAGDL